MQEDENEIFFAVVGKSAGRIQTGIHVEHKHNSHSFGRMDIC